VLQSKWNTECIKSLEVEVVCLLTLISRKGCRAFPWMVMKQRLKVNLKKRHKKKVKLTNQMLHSLVIKMPDVMLADILILELLMLNLIGLLSDLMKEDLELVLEILPTLKPKLIWMLGQSFNKSSAMVEKLLGKPQEAIMNLWVTILNMEK
jgi:hypothetical protein